MLSRWARITTRAVRASTMVPVTRVRTGSAAGLPARTQPISTSTAAAALTAASAVVTCATARENCPVSPGPAGQESPIQGAQPSTQNPAISSSCAAAPGCPLVIFAPTASVSLTVTASRATTGAAPRLPAATARGSTTPSTSRSARGWMSSAANVPGSSPECA